MYGLFTYIYHKKQPNVGKYTSPMDPMGLKKKNADFFRLPRVSRKKMVKASLSEASLGSTLSPNKGSRNANLPRGWTAAETKDPIGSMYGIFTYIYHKNHQM